MTATRERQQDLHTVVAIVALALAPCGHDAADREYYSALRGEETGMGRRVQIEHIDRAIQLAPEGGYYFETRATYRIDLREFDLAIADLDRVVALQDRPYLHFLRGLALCQSGAYERGLADLEAAVAGQPENNQFYRGRGLARVEVGKADEALEDGEHLVRLEPHVAAAYYVRGRARAALGRHEEAIADFTEALRRRPELIYPLIARSESYARIGDVTRAEADRAATATAMREHGDCAMCVDPFRY